MKLRTYSSALVFAIVMHSPALAQSAAQDPSDSVPKAATDVEERFHFNVGAGTLPDVIAGISRQARAAVSIAAPDASRIRVAGVKGTLTLEQALSRILAGSAYSLRRTGRNGFTIVSASGADEIVVTAYRRDYVRTSSSLLTRTDTPIRQIPATVDSVTQEVLKSQNAISVNEAIRNIPGATFNISGANAQIFLNSETGNGVTFSNGLRNSLISNNEPTVNIDAIEVVKGPASVLTGTQIAGGVINFVPKRADGRRGSEVVIGGGSGSEVLAQVDLSGAISREDGVFWRLGAMSQYADTLPQGGTDHAYQRVVNPMVGYRGDGTIVDLGFQYYDKQDPFRPLVAYVPATRAFASWGDALDMDGAALRTRNYKANYNFEQRLVSSPDLTLTLRSRGQVDWGTSDAALLVPYFYRYLLDYSFVGQFNQRLDGRTTSSYTDLYARFATGPVTHQMIVAFDAYWSTLDQQLSVGTLPLVTAANPARVGTLGQGVANLVSSDKAHQYGIIAQDQLTWGRLHALIGLRQTIFRQRTLQVSSATTRQRVNRFLPNAGLVYDLTSGISAYASYAHSITPALGTLLQVDGSPLPPREREQWETGVKIGLFGDAVALNLSAYTFRQDNSPLAVENPTADPALINRYVAVKGQKGRGAEVSASGSITPTLKLLAGYSYSLVRQPSLPEVPLNPSHVANLWAIRSFVPVKGQKIDVGFGGNFSSRFYALNLLTNEYVQVPRNTLQLNGSIAYTIDRVTVNATVNNLLNRTNYVTGSIAGLPIDVPRSFRLTATTRF